MPTLNEDRLAAARDLIGELPRTSSGFPKPPRVDNDARPRGPRTGAAMHYFLTMDGSVYGHPMPNSLVAERFGLSTYGAGTVHLGFATKHDDGSFSLNGHPTVLR